MVLRIDLNADVGEGVSLGHQPADGQGSEGCDRDSDAALMPSVTSASIACGFHAGDPGLMRSTVTLARQHGVAVGAHPSFLDREGFGRRERQATPREIQDLVMYQIGALAAIAAGQGVRLQHVKAHGALYNMAARDASTADAIARATAAVDASLVLFGLSGSELIAAGRRAGLRTASEVFADRGYAPDGALVSRTEAGAVIDDPDAVVERAIAMVRDGSVIAVDGSRVPLQADTICLHGDTPGAATLARRIRLALTKAKVQVTAIGRPSP
jgi:UPF0271 protein